MMCRFGYRMRLPLLASVAALMVGCIPQSGQDPALIAVATDRVAEIVVSGAAEPSALAFAADGRVFYAERLTGQLRAIVDGVLLDTPIATVPANIAGDRGLLGVAVHPNFAQNNRVYVFYSRSDTGRISDLPNAIIDHRVVYFELAGNRAAGGEVFVASIPAQDGTKRVGGRLAFLADGTLLVGVGDQEGGAVAQDASVLAGKVLRYNDDGSIPSDNPTADSPILASGVRFARGLGVDPLSRDGFVTDQNQNGLHELNRVRSGTNLGWPEVAGIAKTAAQLQFAADNPSYADPVFVTGSTLPDVVGGTFNPSNRYGSENRNQFFYGESSNRRVVVLRLNAERLSTSTEIFASGFPSEITDVQFTPAGTLYVATRTTILRIAPK